MQRLLSTEQDGVVHTLTIDSPHNRNALSTSLMAQMLDAVITVGEDPNARVLVLQAAGPAFCSGADLREAATADADRQRQTSRQLLAVLRSLVTLPVPVVAAVHGPARAGGVGLVAACDIAIAGDHATFALGEVRLGLTPAVISTVAIPRLADRDAARLMLGGAAFDATEAARIGLVTRAVPADDLDECVADVVERVAASPRQGLEATKTLLNQALVERIDRDGPALADLSARLFISDVARKHFQRFLEA